MPSRIALFTKLNQQCRCYYIKPRPALKCADAIATIRAVIGIKLTVEKFGIEHEGAHKGADCASMAVETHLFHQPPMGRRGERLPRPWMNAAQQHASNTDRAGLSLRDVIEPETRCLR